MKIKHSDITIKEDDPFENCKLNRKIYAEILTNIVETYPEGFVLGINNEWGTGKTTFVKMWQQLLNNQGYKTLYFNAWENDFDKNPLVAIISELKILTNPSNEKIFKSVMQKGSILAKSILPALLKGVTKKYIDTDIVLEAIENTTKGMTDIFEEEIQEYSNKKQSVNEFRTELEEFIKKSSSNKPLIFIIDELDRCRPNYAVEVLEQIKHLFSVNGIVFVLSIDKIQLGYAIRGVYGNDNINSDEYLRRFIDLEYSIPTPSTNVFCEYLYHYYSFDDFFSSSERIKTSEFKNDKEQFLKMASLLFLKTNITLRQQEKIFGYTRLILNSFPKRNYVFPHLLFVLIYIKVIKSDLYSRIENNAILLQELSDEYSELLPNNLQDKDLYGINLLYIEALLLYFYNNQQGRLKRNLFEVNTDGKVIYKIESKLEKKINQTTLAACIESISRSWNLDDVQITYLLNKINLTEPMVLL